MLSNEMQIVQQWMCQQIIYWVPFDMWVFADN